MILPGGLPCVVGESPVMNTRDFPGTKSLAEESADPTETRKTSSG